MVAEMLAGIVAFAIAAVAGYWSGPPISAGVAAPIGMLGVGLIHARVWSPSVGRIDD